MADALASPRTARASSVSSQGTTGSVVLSLQPRYVPRPEPQYISQSNAADLVTRQHLHDQLDFISSASSPSDGAIFSEPALSLLNSFLDALLYNFLGKAQSTSLNKLRPAIKEVLKAKLARDALADADEELQGLYDESEAEIDGEDEPATGGSSPAWHLEETFKLMRLRVMVFLGLGEFDDDDEERFLEEEEFHINGERATPDMTILNGPTAVYLASVLEYLAERLIDLSGEAAYARQRRRMSTRPISESQELENINPERVVVEETDVEKITLNPTYGRLWRTWRKQHRGLKSGPATPLATSHHTREPSEDGPFQSLKRINGAGQCKDADKEQRKELSLEEIPGVEDELPEYILASNIPLPDDDDDDVDEMEDPGLAEGTKDAGEDQQQEGDDEGGRRPRSAFYFHDSFPGAAASRLGEAVEGRPTPGLRKRSLSAPNLALPTFVVPSQGAEAVEEEAVKADATEEVTKDEVPSNDKVGQKDEERTDAGDTREQSKEQDDGKDEGQQEIVTAVSTGEAALVSSTIITDADSMDEDKDAPTHHTVHEVAEHATKDELDMATPEEESKDAEEAPVSHEAAVAREMGVPLPEVAEEEKDAPLTHEEAVAREMGVVPVKKAVKEEPTEPSAPQKETKTPAKVDNVDELPDLAAAEAQAAAIPAVDATSESKKALVERMPSHELAGEKQSASQVDQKVQPTVAISDKDEHEVDPEAIGIAKTTDIRIQSLSPTPDQGAFYGHMAGQDRRNENFARPSSGDRNAPFGGAAIQRPALDDEYNLARPLQRNSAPSPLREVTTAVGVAAIAGTSAFGAEKAQESLQNKQNVAQNRDKPAYVSPPAAGQQVPQQGTSATSTPSTPKRVSSRADDRGAKVQPLQTDLPDPASVRPPSSAHSSHPPHSARGSQSSIQPRVIDKRASDDTRPRNFDDLVKGEETVKYTLTPDHLRDDVSFSINLIFCCHGRTNRSACPTCYSRPLFITVNNHAISSCDGSLMLYGNEFT